jgi:glycerophosphoryl diester phosphodiesterase
MPDAHTCLWLSSSGPLVFGHRGGRGLAPENTIAAFDRGLAEGVDGLELDVHLSRDGIPVVIHDADVARTTNAAGPVVALTASELAQLDAGFRFAADDGYPWRGRGAGIPRLREVLARYPSTPLIVEMKANSEDLARETVKEIVAAGAARRVCVGSFGLRALSAVRRLAPGIATGSSQEEVRWALVQSWIRRSLRRTRYHVHLVPERRQRLTVVTPRFVRDARAAGLAVFVWTVDTPADVERLLAWGVQGILTDRPDITVPIVRSRRTRPPGFGL